MQCSIVRARGLFPSYALYLDVGHKFLLRARKRKKAKAAAYVISLDEQASGCQRRGLLDVLACTLVSVSYA
jgi:hypothetical protein